jgi:hypothetical protein
MASLLMNGCQITEYQFSKCATGIQVTEHSRHALVNKSSCNEMDGRGSSPCISINCSLRRYVQNDSGAPSLLSNCIKCRRLKREFENSLSEAKERNALNLPPCPLYVFQCSSSGVLGTAPYQPSRWLTKTSK